MKHAKRIGALICAIAICFTLVCAPSAHAVGALGGQAAGAWIAAGLVALNIVAHTGAQAIGSYFGWQSAPSSQSVLEYTFPNATSVISDYMNAATIKVDQGVTTIDGVEYDEVFIEPGTFTNGLKTNLFDFKSKWNIISGQSGITLASGAGHVGGLPVYQTGDTYRTASYGIAPKGSSVIFGEIEQGTDNNGYLKWRKVGHSSWDVNYSDYPGPWFFQGPPASSKIPCVYRENGTVFIGSSSVRDLTFDTNEFDYEYTSGIVPADQGEIPENYGLSIQIPHDKLQTFYNAYPQYNVDNSVINIQQDQIDIDALTQAIFDQITSMEQVKAQWKGEGEPEPEPPGPAEDVLTGVNTIIGQQNTQISQNQQEMQIQQQQLQQQQQQLQQQQQINQNTSSIKETIENVTQTPTSEELPDFKFDLRELFPFCIPFDIYRLLSSFDAEPQAPHVQLPIVIESIGFSYNLDLDFSAWDPVAQAMRTAELIVYAITLAWATEKVIKW